ncbi:permease [Aquimarina brevivitae]|uniref:Permease n=1 Tax=Aquimarina brevivitae TaxID=323412 RepID=A0A4Q7P053_9FLAO|nr:permease [Aquimarina brevivitae]RZS92648.1 hypothetical protein EV197_2787 [Aquimarina brevivitae]
MESTIQKTVVFGIFILLGLLLKYKFTSSAEKQGVKRIILNLALPATIFVALMGVTVDKELLGLPFLALGINVFLFYVFPLLFPCFGIQKGTASYRTLRLMIPSLAPGLSCFPFIAELLGKHYLAKAAMADLGNKVFVLIIMYWIAIRWYFKHNPGAVDASRNKLTSLLIALVSEPVTILILIALGLLSFGFSFDTLPPIAQEVLRKLSLLMTPLVMVFIGLSVKIKKKQLIQLFSILMARAGMVLLFCALCVQLAGFTVAEEAVWIVAFSLSACSFWPYAHIASISLVEQDRIGKEKTFRSGLAVNLLALSFPLSALLIVAVMLNPTFIAVPVHILLLGVSCIALSFFPMVIQWLNGLISTEIKFKYKKVWQLLFRD